MPHETSLITTVVIGLSLAFVFGLLAHRLRLPTIAGYILAGVVIGPFTPGYVADGDIASQLAELGVILLMFGVGLHFSVGELMSVRRVAVPGALVQIAVASGAGMGVGHWLGWSIGGSFLFGLSLSVASTVVLLRALQEHHLVETQRGKIAVGWLIVEDMAMVLALVLIPPLSGVLGGVEQAADPDAVPEAARALVGPIAAAVIWTVAKVSAFVAIMLVIGSRVIPEILHVTALTGSRELFRLAVLAIALGTAFAASSLFGVSLALGSFFAGMVMSRSTLSARAAAETLPLRDAFAVLFFVSVGMLFDPHVLVERPIALLATILVIVVVKSFAAWSLVRVLGRRNELALTVAASLAQIGEFSFILIVMGVQFSIVEPLARDLVVAGALISILLNPALFAAIQRLYPPPPPEPQA